MLERVASGGIISGISSGEGLVCKFTGKRLASPSMRSLLITVRSWDRLYADEKPAGLCCVVGCSWRCDVIPISAIVVLPDCRLDSEAVSEAPEDNAIFAHLRTSGKSFTCNDHSRTA